MAGIYHTIAVLALLGACGCMAFSLFFWFRFRIRQIADELWRDRITERTESVVNIVLVHTEETIRDQ